MTKENKEETKYIIDKKTITAKTLKLALAKYMSIWGSSGAAYIPQKG